MASTASLRFRASSTRTLLQANSGNALRRSLHQSKLRLWPSTEEEPKNASTSNSDTTRKGAPQPKISNLSIPGINKADHLTEEQKDDVRKHNEDFEKKFDHSASSKEGKVDCKFWEESGVVKS